MANLVFLVLIVLGVAVCHADPFVSSIVGFIPKASTPLSVADSFSFGDNTIVSGLTVSFLSGYQTGDTLRMEYGGGTMITATFDSVRATLVMRGTTTTKQYAQALRSVVFSTSSTSTATRVIAWNYGVDTFYSPATGHFYQWNAYGDGGWINARDYCSNRTLLGLQGYMASSLNAEENDFLYHLITQSALLGGHTEDGTEWKWTTGPEGASHGGQGLRFWGVQCSTVPVTRSLTVCSESSAYNCTTESVTTQETKCKIECLPGKYCPWNIGQPDGNSDRSYLQMLFKDTAARWENIPATLLSSGFVCEFGGLGYTLTEPMSGIIELAPSCAMYRDALECNAVTHCSWDSFQSVCSLDPCTLANLEKNGCGKYPHTCVWDRHVNLCHASPCNLATTSSCKAQKECAWDDDNDVCVLHRCTIHMTACECVQDSKCTWAGFGCSSASNAQCPSMDVLFLFEGFQTDEISSDVFQGIRSWLQTAPLSGTGWSSSPSSGVRIAVADYGKDGKIGAFAPGATPGWYTSNLSSVTGNQFSGVHDEVMEALTWAQANGNDGTVEQYLEPALRATLSMFSRSGTLSGSRKIAFIVTAGQFTDFLKITMGPQLAAEGIEVFGLIVSPTETTADLDSLVFNSLAKLAYPVDTHIMSIDSEDVFSTLAGLCNSKTAIGQSIAVAATRSYNCGGFADARSCVVNALCTWDYSTSSCALSRCVQYCSQTLCSNEAHCTWSTTLSACTKKTCDGTEPAACSTQGSHCTFDTQTQKCSYTSCWVSEHAQSCGESPEKCIWSSGVCTPDSCIALSVADCKSASSCSVKQVGGVSKCLTNPCAALTTETTCSATTQCSWNSSSCKPIFCAQYGTAYDCVVDAKCSWNDLSAECEQNRCASFTTQSLCKGDTRCNWVASSCVEGRCSDYTSIPSCMSNPNCMWSTTLAACRTQATENMPGTDYYFLFGHDLSTSNADSTASSNDFNLALATIRRVIMQYPLTGTKANTPVAAETAGARISLLQFSREGIVSPLTGGNPSGLQSELLDDLAWHAAQPVTAMNSIILAPALNKALNLVSSSATTYRQTVVIILSKTAVTDILQVAAPIRKLQTQQAILQSYTLSDSATILQTWKSIGFSAKTVQPSDLLATLVSQAVVNVRQTAPVRACTLLSKDACEESLWCSYAVRAACVLGSECPNLKCHLPLKKSSFAYYRCDECSLQGGKVECGPSAFDAGAQQPPIAFTAPSCANVECAAVLPIDECMNVAGCEPIDGACLKVRCRTKTTSEACATDTTCMWSNSRCVVDPCTKLAKSDDCLSQAGCEWRASSPGSVDCHTSVCATTDENECVKASCTWDVSITPHRCIKQQCRATSEADCVFDTKCQWNSLNQSCALDVCRLLPETSCTKPKGCAVSQTALGAEVKNVCRAVYCQTSDELICKSDPRCVYTAGTGCAEDSCMTWGDEATCNRQTSCHWNIDISPGACVTLSSPKRKCSDFTDVMSCGTKSFCTFSDTCKSSESIGCPEMDVVFLVGSVDGSKTQVSRHSSSFLGMTEAIRKWLEVVMPSGKVRASFMVLSEGAPKVSAQGAKGALSGVYGDLEADIAWQQQNFVAADPAKWSFAPALDAAGTVLTTATRKRLVVLVADGEPSDLNKAIESAKTLGTQKIIVVTLAIRRLLQSEPSLTSRKIGAALSHLATDDLWWLLYIDQMEWQLRRLCSATSTLGMEIGATGTTCLSYMNEVACRQDSRCSWDVDLPYPCPKDTCANLGCISLPSSALYANLSCENCIAVDGEVQCTASTFNPVTRGACRSSVCFVHNSQSCPASSGCVWEDSTAACVTSVCRYTTFGSCISDAACEWDSSLGGGKCRTSHCSANTERSDCAANAYCAWSVLRGTETCNERQCLYVVNTVCDLDPRCMWSGGKCTIRTCQFPTQSSCLSDVANNCLWDVSDPANPYCRQSRCSSASCSSTLCVEDAAPNADFCAGLGSTALCSTTNRCTSQCAPVTVCRERLCTYTVNTDCTADARCTWNGASCAERDCTKIRSEGACYASASACYWDVSGICTAQTAPLCSSKSTPCVCATSEECVWSGGCVDRTQCDQSPPLDIFFAIDGSVSMVGEVGNHASGVIGVIESLRSWISTVKLTGTATATSTTPGARIGVARLCSIPSCAGSSCVLNGELAKINADLTALKSATAVEPCTADDGLASIRDTLLTSSRQQILVLVSASELRVQTFKAQMLQRRNTRLTVYGVALEGNPGALRSLSSLVNIPASLYLSSVAMSQFPQFIRTICTQGSMFSPITLRDVTASTKQCGGSGMLECASSPLCEWDPSGLCSNGGCPQLDCQVIPADLTATGIECPNCRIIDGALTCSLSYHASNTGICKPASCAKSCSCSDASCMLSGGQCVRRLCTYTTKSTCTADLACYWSNSSCQTSKCAFRDKKLCLSQPGCSWNAAELKCRDSVCPSDPSACPACSYPDSAACNTDKKCMWSKDTAACTKNPCDVNEDGCSLIHNSICLFLNGKCSNRKCTSTNEAECASFSECYWNNGACFESCKYRYASELACKAPLSEDLDRCVWSTIATTCQESCLATPLASCATTMCEVRQGKCEETCASKYKTATDCGAAPNCQWEEWKSPAQCATKCTELSVTQCLTADGSCVLDGTSCKLRCTAAANTAESCKAVGRCYWNSELSICDEPSCASCTSGDTRCAVSGTKCGRRCDLINHAEECTNRSDCVYTLKSCRAACAGLDRSTCFARDDCMWTEDGCATSCAVQFTDIELCNVDPKCEWDYTAQVCILTPCDRQTPAECSADPSAMCTWESTSTRTVRSPAVSALNNAVQMNVSKYVGCTVTRFKQTLSAAGFADVYVYVTPCDSLKACPFSTTHFTQQLDCGCATKGFIHVSAGNVLTWPRFPQGVTNAGSGYIISSPVFTFYMFADTLLSATFEMELSCPGLCARPCTSLMSKAACTTGASCEWDDENDLCNVACGKYATQVECSKQTRCEYHTGASPRCQLRCERRGTTSESDCAAFPVCRWDGDNSICVSNCSLLHTTECSNAAHCALLGGAICRPKCELTKDTQACSASGYCMWDNVNSLCVVQCDSGLTAAECRARSQCTYDAQADKCVRDCRQQDLTQAACKRLSYCTWNPLQSSCVPACSRSATAAECSSELCVFYEGRGCRTRCPFLYSDVDSCESDTKCQWIASTLKCASKCGPSWTKNECIQSAECQWSGSACELRCPLRAAADCSGSCQMVGAVCSPTCNSYTTDAECSSRSYCFWSGTSCVGTCSSSTMETCKQDSNCEWNPFISACEYKCSKRSLPQCQLSPSLCAAAAPACASLATLFPQTSNGTTAVQTSEGLMLQLAGTSGAPGTVTYKLGGVYTSVTGTVDTYSLCALCPPALSKGWDVAFLVGSAGAVAQSVSLVCSDPPLPVSFDLGLLDTMAIRVTPKSAASCGHVVFNAKVCASANQSTCQTMCAAKHSKEVSCQDDDQCMWDSGASSCRTACETKTTAQCLGDALCQYVASAAVPCQRLCSSMPKPACLKSTHCTFADGKCFESCHLRLNQVDCITSAQCQWMGDTVTPSCSLRCSTLPTKEACATMPQERCLWNDHTNECRQKCEFNTAGIVACESDPLCEYRDSACHTPCSSLYKASTLCNLDPACMWNPTTSACGEACGRLSPAMCASSEICDLVNGQCVKACGYRHTGVSAQTTCQADSTCMWDTKRSACTRVCGTAATRVDCQSIVQCEWKTQYEGKCESNPKKRVRCAPVGTTRSACENAGCCYNASCTSEEACSYPFCFAKEERCIPLCSYRYDTSLCQTDSSCVWNTQTYTCENSCTKRNSADLCASTDTCEWNTNSLSCVQTCSAKYATQATCSADANCAWSAALSKCRPACSAMQTYSLCQQYSEECFWNETTVTCTDECFLAPIQATCTRLPHCLWDPVALRCGLSCARRSTAIPCSASSNCWWSQEDSVCVGSCSTYQTSKTCNASAYCVWSSSSCVLPCHLKYPSPASCNTDNDCVWDTTTASCRGSCAQILRSAYDTDDDFATNCAQNDACALMGSLCKRKCTWRYSTKAACADNECVWNQQSSICATRCDVLTLQSTCVDNAMCAWNYSAATCQYTCRFAASSAATCAATPGCLWDEQNEICEPTCSTIKSAYLCNSDAACRWSNGQCSQGCANSHTSELSCNSDPQCIFDLGDMVCKKDCALLDASQCNMNGDVCIVVDGVCRRACHLRYSKKSDCIADSTCMWDGSMGACRAGCPLAKSLHRCQAMTMCEWRPDLGACGYACNELDSEDECSYVSYCEFSPSTLTCKKKCAERHGTVSSCNSDPDCLWDFNTNLCAKSCEQVTTAIACSSLLACTWNAAASCAVSVSQRVACAPSNVTQQECSDLGCCFAQSAGPWCFQPIAACSRRCSTKYYSQADCNKDDDCAWDTVRYVCSRRCSKAQSMLDCSTMPMCEWYAGVCQQQCAYAHSRCSLVRCGRDVQMEPCEGRMRCELRTPQRRHQPHIEGTVVHQ